MQQRWWILLVLALSSPAACRSGGARTDAAGPDAVEVPTDRREVVEQALRAGDRDAAAEAWSAYEPALLPADYKDEGSRALALAACDSFGVMDACYWLARDTDDEVTERARRAALACDAGRVGACAVEAEVIAGAGAVTTAARAGELAARLCAAPGAPMCDVVTDWFSAGGEPGGDAPVLEAARQGCVAGAEPACAGALLLEHRNTGSGDRSRIVSDAMRLCAAGFGVACDVHGEMLLRGDGTPEDVPAGIAILGGRCERQARRACQALRLACRHGIRDACTD